jgi:polyketide biosynthesis enoyl-CoA hydratase PksH
VEGILIKDFETIRVRLEDEICYLQIYRPDAKNTINECLIVECSQAIKACEESAKILVFEGLPDIFCFGADFQEMQQSIESEQKLKQNSELLYNLWLQMATGPFISIAHVQGHANAGGVGFVAACDIVLSDERAIFSLSELLFGLIPACVLPFLIRRIGFSKANNMTLTTRPISAKLAHNWGLVDAYEENSKNLLRKQLLRLRRITKKTVLRYKEYMGELNEFLITAKKNAIPANFNVFSDQRNIDYIIRYLKYKKLPWEND